MYKRARWQLFHDETREDDDDVRRGSSDESGDSSDDENITQKIAKACMFVVKQPA